MASRYTEANFTTGSCAPNGGTVNHDLTIPSNTMDIVKIKVIPSISTGDNIVKVHAKATRGTADLIYTTAKWTGTSLLAPQDKSGVEHGEGWLFPYFDKDESLKLHFQFQNFHTVAKTYNVIVTYEYISTDDPGIVGAPEGLVVQATANGLKVLTGVVAQTNNATITEAEFRAIRLDVGDLIVNQDLRLVSEGGSFVPDGVDKLQVTGLVAGPYGCNYSFTSGDHGRWYYAWRLKNSVGWSRWSDGNVYPQNVPHWVRTQTYEDTGPPQDWEVWVEEGPSTGTIVVHATRPRTNGNTLLWWLVQVKDGDTGAWLALDDGTAPSEVKYDGSATAHAIDGSDGSKITKSASGWGSAEVGDLILLDVRGSDPLDFNVDYCIWGTVDRMDGNALYASGVWSGTQATTNMTLKIVKPPWMWSGGGYLGLESNQGFWGGGPENNGLGKGWILGNNASEFSTDSIQIPTTVTNPEARVWFQNLYSRSDDGVHSTGMEGGKALITAPATFTDFNNRNYWIPVYPATGWGTLSFNATTGAMTAACGSYDSYHSGIAGVRARFRLHPDSTGLMEVYCKFENVTIPVGTRTKGATASGDLFGIGIHVSNQGFLQGNARGACMYNQGNDAGNVVVDAMYYMSNFTPFNVYSTYEPIYYSANPNFARPVAGSIVELKWQFGVKNNIHQTTGVLVRVGGSGSYTTKTPSYAQEGPAYATGAMEIFVGILGNCMLTGGTAKLTQVSIINGLLEFY